MKLYLIGQKPFGAAVFDLCHSLGHQVAGVCAPLPSRDRADHLYATATMVGLAVDASPQVMPAGVDLIVAAHCHVFIPPELLRCARLGGIAYHPSLLPIHRGRDAIRWAVHMRERVTGGTVYWLTEGVDAGDVAAQEHVFIRPDDTPRALWERELFPLGLRLFERVLVALAAGQVVRVPQDHDLATWEPAFGRARLRSDAPTLGPHEALQRCSSES